MGGNSAESDAAEASGSDAVVLGAVLGAVALFCVLVAAVVVLRKHRASAKATGRQPSHPAASTTNPTYSQEQSPFEIQKIRGSVRDMGRRASDAALGEI